MRIATLRISGFQSFGPEPTEIKLTSLTYILGPNGSGKTAVLRALARLFASDPSLRRLRRDDFHVPLGADAGDVERSLWIEVDFEFPEAGGDANHATIPAFFSHMALEAPGGVLRARARLSGRLDVDGYIAEELVWVVDADGAGQPITTHKVSRFDRDQIQVHYLPAQRDPHDHVSYATASLLGRALRAANWDEERAELDRLSGEISLALSANAAVDGIGAQVKAAWSKLHTGSFFRDPALGFGTSDLEGILRHLTLAFTPSPDGRAVDFERLSDGQRSLLYVSLVLAMQKIGRDVLQGTNTAFDPDKLRPPVFTVVAMEEPENSLAPVYLGRIIASLRDAGAREDAQGLIATHAPALLRRVDPEEVRYLRLDDQRQTRVASIRLPPKASDAHKFVREAVQAFPELYFARLVVLGEGASEQIVLPRVLAASGLEQDNAAIAVVPLGGRHVNHFWRLLHGLRIPYLTLLDLDYGRYQGGWGRLTNAFNQINGLDYDRHFRQESVDGLPKWNARAAPETLQRAVLALEGRNVFFSSAVDLDLMMLAAYPEAFGVTDRDGASAVTIKAVLGKNNVNSDLLDADLLTLFDAYHSIFQVGGKPAAHLEALAVLSDEELLAGLPKVLGRLVDAVRVALDGAPE
jgi:putative ATP-dependent endonuclease of OLD family